MNFSHYFPYSSKDLRLRFTWIAHKALGRMRGQSYVSFLSIRGIHFAWSVEMSQNTPFWGHIWNTTRPWFSDFSPPTQLEMFLKGSGDKVMCRFCQSEGCFLRWVMLNFKNSTFLPFLRLFTKWLKMLLLLGLQSSFYQPSMERFFKGWGTKLCVVFVEQEVSTCAGRRWIGSIFRHSFSSRVWAISCIYFHHIILFCLNYVWCHVSWVTERVGMLFGFISLWCDILSGMREIQSEWHSSPHLPHVVSRFNSSNYLKYQHH